MGLWQTTEIGTQVHSIQDVLDWPLHKKSLREELIDVTRRGLVIPEEAWDTWMGEVELRGTEFLVTITYSKKIA